MKITHLAASVLIAALGVTRIAHAGSDQAGTTAAGFLTIGVDPATQARGGATLGLLGSIGAVEWNPGALGFQSETQIALSHATLSADLTQEYFAAGGRLAHTGVHWALSGLYEGQGSIAGRDALDNPTGTFDLSSFAGGAHFAYPIAGVAAVGVGAKWVNEGLGTVRGSGFTFDYGLQAHAGMLGFGLAAQNAVGSMRFGSQSYAFPANYGVGVSLDHARSGLRLALDANFPKSYYNDVRTGVEWRWHDLVAVRAGYRSELAAPAGESLSGPTFGFGAGVFGLWFDYGYIVPGSGDAEHRVGITLRPGRMNSSGGLGAATHSTGMTAPISGSAASGGPTSPVVTTPQAMTSSPPPASAPAVTPSLARTPAVTAPAASTHSISAAPDTSVARSSNASTHAATLRKHVRHRRHLQPKPAAASPSAAKPASNDPFDAAIERAKKIAPGSPDQK